MNNSLNELTVCILTKDHPSNLNLQVTYYAKHKIRIMVLDASVAPFKGIMNSYMDYHHLPGLDYHKRLIYLLNRINTKFIVLQADDDFHGLQGLSRSVEFLEKSPNFISTQGSYIRFHSKCPLTWLPDYVYQNQLEIVDEDPLVRTIALSNSGMHFIYSVMRTEVFFEIVSCLKNIEVGILAMNELVFTLTLGLFGSYTTLQSFYSARDGVQISTNPGIRFEDWENSEKSQDFRIFKMNVVRLYSMKTNLSLSQADAFVTYIFEQMRMNSIKKREKHAIEVQIQSSRVDGKLLKDYAKKIISTRMFITLYPYRKVSTWIYTRNLILKKTYFSFKTDIRKIKRTLAEQK